MKKYLIIVAILLLSIYANTPNDNAKNVAEKFLYALYNGDSATAINLVNATSKAYVTTFIVNNKVSTNKPSIRINNCQLLFVDTDNTAYCAYTLSNNINTSYCKVVNNNGNLLVDFNPDIDFEKATIACNALVYLNGVNAMDYKSVKKVCTNKSLKLIEIFEAFESSIPDSVKEANANIEVDIIKVQIIDAQNAIVDYKESDQIETNTIKLIKENNNWLINETKEEHKNTDLKDVEAAANGAAEDAINDYNSSLGWFIKNANSPNKSAENFFATLNDMDYAEAEKYCTNNGSKYIQQVIAADNKLSAIQLANKKNITFRYIKREKTAIGYKLIITEVANPNVKKTVLLKKYKEGYNEYYLIDKVY